MYIQISLMVVGFFITSLMFYLNHRFVGHGPLGKWPLLHHMRRLHLIHHKNDYNDNRNSHLRLPFWAKVAFLSVFLLVTNGKIKFTTPCSL